MKEEDGRVDYDEMEALAHQHKPKLIVGGGSAYVVNGITKRMREIADSVGAIFMDMAHPGRVDSGRVIETPVKYAHGNVYHAQNTTPTEVLFWWEKTLKTLGARLRRRAK